MNEVTILHQKAMEFADEARLAKMEGKIKTAQSFFEKAYSLEYEAVRKFDYDDVTAKAILTRSAAALAIEAQLFVPAQMLLTRVKSYNLPQYLLDEVTSLEEILTNYFKKDNTVIQIKGRITYANAAKNLIKIELSDTTSLVYTIQVPNDQINDIVKSYWADTVIVQGKTNKLGIITMSNIDKAA